MNEFIISVFLLTEVSIPRLNAALLKAGFGIKNSNYKSGSSPSFIYNGRLYSDSLLDNTVNFIHRILPEIGLPFYGATIAGLNKDGCFAMHSIPGHIPPAKEAPNEEHHPNHPDYHEPPE